MKENNHVELQTHMNLKKLWIKYQNLIQICYCCCEENLDIWRNTWINKRKEKYLKKKRNKLASWKYIFKEWSKGRTRKTLYHSTRNKNLGMKQHKIFTLFNEYLLFNHHTRFYCCVRCCCYCSSLTNRQPLKLQQNTSRYYNQFTEIK